ncbi:hypothetical protein AB8O55_25280 [Saccharopolyspora cebuensis]|uniref:Uncharacterized protein n=1 Tax=Saccharopolyspora cebuensis TaxID=418759 RepID=A0ABV4CRC5_9PSEU
MAEEEARAHLALADIVDHSICGHRLRGHWTFQQQALSMPGRELCPACTGSPEVDQQVFVLLVGLLSRADLANPGPAIPAAAWSPSEWPTSLLATIDPPQAA